MNKISLLRFSKDGLPDLRGALSMTVPSAAIAQANEEMQKLPAAKSRSVDHIRSTALVFVPKSSVSARSPSRSFLQLRCTYALYFEALAHIQVLYQQLLPISCDKCGSHEHSRLFGVRVRLRPPLCTCIIADRSKVRTRVKNIKL